PSPGTAMRSARPCGMCACSRSSFAERPVARNSSIFLAMLSPTPGSCRRRPLAATSSTGVVRASTLRAAVWYARARNMSPAPSMLLFAAPAEGFVERDEVAQGVPFGLQGLGQAAAHSGEVEFRGVALLEKRRLPLHQTGLRGAAHEEGFLLRAQRSAQVQAG